MMLALPSAILAAEAALYLRNDLRFIIPPVDDKNCYLVITIFFTSIIIFYGIKRAFAINQGFFLTVQVVLPIHKEVVGDKSYIAEKN